MPSREIRCKRCELIVGQCEHTKAGKASKNSPPAGRRRVGGRAARRRLTSEQQYLLHEALRKPGKASNKRIREITGVEDLQAARAMAQRLLDEEAIRQARAAAPQSGGGWRRRDGNSVPTVSGGLPTLGKRR